MSNGIWSCEFVGGPNDGQRFAQPAIGPGPNGKWMPALEYKCMASSGLVHVYRLGRNGPPYYGIDQRGYTVNYIHIPEQADT